MKKRVICILLCVLLLMTMADYSVFAEEIRTETEEENLLEAGELNYYDDPEPAEGTFVRYLSDLTDGEIVRKQIGWGSYGRDKAPDAPVLSLMIGGTRTYFRKGVGMHAKADVIYDLGSTDVFETFSAFLGVDASRGRNGYAAIRVYVSNTPAVESSWVLKADTGFKCGNDAATEVNISLATETPGTYYRYLRIYCDPGDVNSADHTVVCNAKLTTTRYNPKSETEFHPLSYYDSELQMIINGAGSKSLAELFFDTSAEGQAAALEAKRILMHRTLMSFFGSGDTGFYYLTLSFLRGAEGEDHRALLEWLMSDDDALAEFLAGGEPDGGSYTGALLALSKLYKNYKSDLSDTSALFSGDGVADPALVYSGTARDGKADDPDRRKGDVYQTLMIAIALCSDHGVYSWLNNSEAEDPVERYRRFKINYLDAVNHLRHDIFENLEVEEMRWVVGARVYNDELYWLNYYCRQRSGSKNYVGVYSPHQFLRYGKDWNYAGKGYLTEANFLEKDYTSKYILSVTNSSGEDMSVGFSTKPKMWMVFDGSHICWGISYVGTNFAAAFGIPSHYALQPGHAVWFIMNRDLNGNITWGIDNNISGWTQTVVGQSETVGRGVARMMCDWGTYNGGWTSYWCGSYLMLSQYAMNHYDAYEKAELLMDLERYLTTDAKKEALYREVLSILPIHLDAWYGLVTLYKKNHTVTEMAELSAELREAMQYFPLPMHDLMNQLKNGVNAKPDTDENTKAENNAALAFINFQEQQGLNAGSIASSVCTLSDLNQPGVCETMAKSLKGSFTGALASFSFTGDNAGRIVFGSDYEGVRYRYSLDGGETWTASGTHITTAGNMSCLLSDTELDSITAENDILIWLEGWASEKEDNAPDPALAFRIDILSGSAVSGVELNDNENRLLGSISNLEYSADGGGTWYPYTSDVRFDGDQSVIFHRVRNGVTLQGPNSGAYQFTADTDTEKRSYIYIENLTLADFSSEQQNQNDYASHIIDGRLGTRWHTYWNGSDKAKYVTLKADEPTFFSGIDYTPVAGGGNGTFYACSVYVSIDGQDWYLAGSASGWANNANKKSLTFADPAYGQYIKIVATSTVGSYASGRLIEVFEDLTFAGKTIAGVKLTTDPVKEVYDQGESPDISGARIECVYTDGSSHVVPHSVLKVSPEVFTKTGVQTMSIRYLDLPEMTFSVYVEKNTRTAEQGSIDILPDRLIYFTDTVKDTIDLSGIRFLLSDANGSWYAGAEDAEVISITEPVTEELTPGAEVITPVQSEHLEPGTWVVNLTVAGLSMSYEITVKKEPVSLEIVKTPDKSDYNIGDVPDLTGLVLKVTYADSLSENLNPDTGGFSWAAEDFSVLPGDQTVTVTLDVKPSLTAEFSLRVLSNLYDGDFQYDVLECTTTPKTYQCFLSAYTNANAETVSVPATVTKKGVTYQVIGVRKGAFAATPCIKNLSLPGSIEILEEGALTDLICLENLYLTGISDIKNLTIAEGALPEENEKETTIYMADEDRQDDLDEKLKDYLTEAGEPLTDKMKTGDLIGDGQIVSMTMTPPEKRDYELGEKEDSTGLSVEAELVNGIVIPMGAGVSYNTSGFDSSVYGEKTVTVSLIGTELSDKYSVNILRTAPVISVHPADATYLSKTAPVAALTVSLKEPGDYTYRYQWRKSKTAVLHHESDTVFYPSDSDSFTPSESGWYYVEVTRVDGNGVESVKAYSMAAHVQIEDFPLIIEGKQKGYYHLKEAFSGASSGDVILVKGDFTVNGEAYTNGKSLTLKGSKAGFTGYRAPEYTGSFIEVNGGSLVIENLTLDGGAEWTGTEDTVLKRGKENSGLVSTGVLVRAVGNGSLTLGSGSVIQNVAAGGTIWGAAVYLADTASFTMQGGIIRNCSTTNNGSDTNGAPGGGILLESTGTVRMESGLISGCFGVRGGGVAVCAVGAKFELLGGTIENCSATYYGGGIYGDSGTVSIKGGIIENCGANIGGGAAVNTANVFMDGGTIRSCAAPMGGGGLATVHTNTGNQTIYGRVVVRGGEISGCSAVSYIGGAVYSRNAGRIYVEDGEFLNNSAKWGGALGTNSAATGETPVSGGTFRGNSGTLGSAVFIGGASKLLISGGLYSENIVPAGGAVISFYNGGAHTVSGGLFLYGGEFLGGSAGACFTNSKATVALTGGVYSTEPKASYLASGYTTEVVTVSGKSLYRVFPANTANAAEIVVKQTGEIDGGETLTAQQIYELLLNGAVTGFSGTELRAATILHEEKGGESLSGILETLKDKTESEELKTEIGAKEAGDVRVYIHVDPKRVVTSAIGTGGGTAVTEAEFDVTPMAEITTAGGEKLTGEIPNGAVYEKVAFRLPVDGSAAGKNALVYHEGQYLGVFTISCDEAAGERYISLYAEAFSTYSYIFLPDEVIPDRYSEEISPQVLSMEADPAKSLDMQFNVSAEDFEELYLEITFLPAGGDVFIDRIYTGYESSGDGQFRFTCDMVIPQLMGDAIAPMVYGRKDGVWYRSSSTNLFRYSDVLKKRIADSGDAGDPLATAMLIYGAAVQKHASYRTGALVNAGLLTNASYLAGVRDHTEDEVTSVRKVRYESKGVTITSTALALETSIGILVKFELDEGCSIEDVSFTNSYNSEVVTSFTKYGDRYGFVLRGITFDELDTPITFTAKVGRKVSQTYTYSVNSYLAARLDAEGTEGDLARALYNLGVEAAISAKGEPAETQ